MTARRVVVPEGMPVASATAAALRDACNSAGEVFPWLEMAVARIPATP
jgi:hypothetical protein